jgi:hypothetical protein
MKPHAHDHSHDSSHGHTHERAHGHGKHEHHAPGEISSDASPDPLTHRHSREGGNPGTVPDHTHGSVHHHGLDSRLLGNDGTFGVGLLMTSSFSRVLVALGLIAMLWLAVAWAVLFID